MVSATSIAKRIAASFGVHMVWNYQNPNHTLLGLRKRSFGTILDVGANVGQFARAMASTFPEATIHCFEPTPDAFEKLKAWSLTVANAQAINTALGEVEETTSINFHPGKSAISSFLNTSQQTEDLLSLVEPAYQIPVRVVTLDSYIASLESPLRGDILLKLDVQGFEASVLRGARRTLKSVTALIAEICVAPLYEGQSSFLEITELAAEAGLTYAGNLDQSYDPDGRVLWLDAMFVRSNDC